MMINDISRYTARVAGVALIAGSVVLSGCDIDSLLEVTDPDTVNPGTLDDPALLSTVVAGAYRQFVVAYSGDGGEAFVSTTGLLSDEYIAVGSFPTRIALDQREQQPPGLGNPQDGRFVDTHQARYALIEAAKKVEEFESTADPRYPELKSLEGYTHVMLAEGWCPAVPISAIGDGGEFLYGEAETGAQLFQRAVDLADVALTNGGGDLAAVLKGRALLGLGQPQQAAQAVSGVSTDFAYYAAHSTEAATNGIFELQDQRRYSVGENEGGNGLDYRTTGDLRLPVYEDDRGGFNTNFDFQMFGTGRYPTRNSRTPIATGVEARLIEAEAALDAGAPGDMIDILNDLRTDAVGLMAILAPEYVPPAGAALAELTDPGSEDARRDLLFQERAYWLYLTGHRLGDMRRLVAHYGLPADQVFPVGEYHIPGEGNYGTDASFQIDQDEANNPNYELSQCDPGVAVFSN